MRVSFPLKYRKALNILRPEIETVFSFPKRGAVKFFFEGIYFRTSFRFFMPIRPTNHDLTIHCHFPNKGPQPRFDWRNKRHLSLGEKSGSEFSSQAKYRSRNFSSMFGRMVRNLMLSVQGDTKK